MTNRIQCFTSNTWWIGFLYLKRSLICSFMIVYSAVKILEKLTLTSPICDMTVLLWLGYCVFSGDFPSINAKD